MPIARIFLYCFSSNPETTSKKQANPLASIPLYAGKGHMFSVRVTPYTPSSTLRNGASEAERTNSEPCAGRDGDQKQGREQC